MLTPAYSVTATERVLPRMALDFTTGVLDSRVTVTRALNTATRVNSSGYIEVVNANLPRFDYNPVTLAALGLLIEESRANVLTYSNELNNASYWTVNNCTVSAFSGTAPDGTTGAWTITSTSTTETGIYRAPSVSGAHTESIYAKQGTGRYLYVNTYASGPVLGRAWFDLQTGTTVGTPDSGVTQTITPAGDGWYRCTATFTGPNRATFFVTNSTSDVTSSVGLTIHLYGAQLEAGTFATSYIPTTTTSLTRNADAVTMTGTNFSDWYNATEGTLFAQVTGITFGSGTAKGVVSVSGGSYLNSINMYYKADGTTNYGEILAGGAAEAVFTLTPQTNKVAIAYKANNANMGYGGLVGTTDTSMTVPSGINQMIIGNVYSTSSSNHPNGCIQKIAYYPQRLTNAELQAITK